MSFAVVAPLAAALVPVGAGVVLMACHADPDDAAGQAGELEDPVRRQNAIANIHRLYTSALSKNGGDRSHADVKAIADAAVEKLTETYVNHPEDTQNGKGIMDALFEMRDGRAVPAYLKALQWQAEVNEEHGVRAAQAIRVTDVSDAQKGELVTGLSEALERVSGDRRIDRQMRVEFIRTLGALSDRRATPILVRVATTQSEEQDFLINWLAAYEIARLGDPEAVSAMVKCLFLFDPKNPFNRMNDVAAQALVSIGRPSYEPLLHVLSGNHDEANAVADQYIEAVRLRDENAARTLSRRQETSREATFALGSLGFREALQPLMGELQAEDYFRRINASIAMVRLNLEPADVARVREAIERSFREAPEHMTDLRQRVMAQAQLLAAMRHLYDPSALPFFLEQVEGRDTIVDLRLVSVQGYALLANKAEAARLRAVIAAEPSSEEGGLRENFTEEAGPALDAANACDEDVACWVQKLSDSEGLVVRKAAYMLGRLGRGNEAAQSALVEKLGHRDIEVRLAALMAIDRIASHGSQAAVDRIDELKEQEEGRQIWNQFKREALPIQARLRARGEPG